MKEIDLAQNMKVYALLNAKYPDHSGFKKLLKDIGRVLEKRKATLKKRTVEMVRETAEDHSL
jgi:hypothetical protein